MADVDRALLRCVKVGSKVRVRIQHPNYNGQANCQFPKDLRVVGATFSVPCDAITFAVGANGTVFYRIRKNAIAAEDPGGAPPARPRTVYTDEFEADCVVCMDAVKQVVFVPCGHFYTCAVCANRLDACPICRQAITGRFNSADIDGR